MAAVLRSASVRSTYSSFLAAKTGPSTTFKSSTILSSRQWTRSCGFSPPRFMPRVSILNRHGLAPIVRVAAFHTSGRLSILPPGPQVIEGTANDPAPVPEPSPTHGSYHWTFERLGSAALVPLVIAPFAAGSLNPIMDAILCATILIHSHIGFQSIIIDYIPGKRLPRTKALFWWGLRGATLIVAVGFYEFETNDVGLTEGIKRIWSA